MTSSMATKEYLKLIKTFPLVPIRDDDHLDKALEVVDVLLARKRNNDLTDSEVEYLAVLSDLIKHYESERIPVDALSPAEVLVYLMKENGLKQAQLVHLFSSKSTLSEVLNGRREFSKDNAFRLAEYFGLSPVAFLY
ncbi:MAG: helix-turn-helix domain-containing protein [Candidatus Obscuribacterales bacterium]|nr:helix-turn-helix domain-containing protein [Candidatus Obscuribacterales bacterium]